MAEQVAAASSLPSLWAPVLNGAIGIVAANHGAYKQYKYNSRLQKEAAKLNYKYAEKQLRNSPTWNRAGLEGAGYNPMLAVQNATAGANSSWTSNSSVAAPDYSGLGLGDMISNAARLKEIQNQTAQTESQIDLNNATAENQSAEAANRRAENPYISQREEANIKQTEANTTKLQNESENIRTQTGFLDDYLELEKKKLEFLKYSADLNFAGVQYSANRSFDAAVKSARMHNAASTYNATTMKEIADEHSPSGASMTFRNYAGGASDIIRAILDGAPTSFENSNDYETHQVNYDKHGNVVGQKTTKHSGGSKSKKRR